MDTSINFNDIYAYDLCQSDDHRERGLYLKVRDIVEELVAQLKPILKYVAVPLPVLSSNTALTGCSSRRNNVGDPFTGRERGVKLLEVKSIGGPESEKVCFLFLDTDALFFLAERCCGGEPGTPDHFHRLRGEISHTWSRAKFGELLGALNHVLKEAIQKREVHLANIKERSEKLDEILAILRRP